MAGHCLASHSARESTPASAISSILPLVQYILPPSPADQRAYQMLSFKVMTLTQDAERRDGSPQKTKLDGTNVLHMVLP